jgi:hypothetical protein
MITPTAHALKQEKQSSLSNGHKNWDDFRHLIKRLTLNVCLETKQDTEVTVKFFDSNKLKIKKTLYSLAPITNTSEQKLT